MAKPSFVNTTMMGSPVYPVFINNPVIVTIQAGTFPTDSSFRQIVVKVIAEVMAVDLAKKYNIDGYIGYVNSLKYSVGENGISIVDVELYYV